MKFENIIPASFEDQIRQWMKEDIPSFDIGGYVVGSEIKKATLFIKSEGVLAGVPFFSTVFKLLNCKVKWLLEEGSYIKPNSKTEIAYVTGEVRKILSGERLALNILSRASGVATKSFKIKNLAQKKGFNGKIAGTRKTTPGFRLVEKYGLLVGGVDTHRMDLSSMVMLKDNHIASVGSIKNAIVKAKQIASVWINIEVECSSLEDAITATESGADIIMLDNFNPTDLNETSKILKQKFPNIIIEVSGGINEQNIEEYFNPHVDIISLGSLTNNYSPIDYSLKI